MIDPRKESERIFVAVDTTDLDAARHIVDTVYEYVGGIKIGLGFYVKHGLAGVQYLMRGRSIPLFLDLKYHDIPNTVEEAIAGILPLRPHMVTVHVSGGTEMMRQVKQRSLHVSQKLAIPPPLILGVTILTSLQDSDLRDLGYGRSMASQVVKMAKLAQDTGLDGVVCSAAESMEIREVCGKDFILAIPGIRLKNGAKHDQKRSTSPVTARHLQADYLIIGRCITLASDMVKTIQSIVKSIETANPDKAI